MALRVQVRSATVAQPRESFIASALFGFGLLLFALAFQVLSALPAQAQDNELGGRPFTPRDKILPMPDDWVNAPVEHTTPAPVDLAIALDQQLYPSLGPIIETYAKERGLRIAVQDGTCGISAGALSEKTVDMGGFCCPPGVTDRLPGLKYHTIGIGALALIGHQDTPVDSLTLANARAMFSGNITNWSELPKSGLKPGPGSEVLAVGRLHCKVRPGHWRLILDDKERFSWNLQEVSAIVDMLDQVSRNPGALGYETLWHIDTQRKVNGAKVKVLNIEGADPHDTDAVASGRYPLYRVFNVTTWGDGPAHSALADELVEHLIANADQIPSEFAIIPARSLRNSGWQFEGNELVGEPGD